MGDIYFSDKNKKSGEGTPSRRITPDPFKDTDYFDENFELNFKKQSTGSAFTSDRFRSEGSVGGENLYSQTEKPLISEAEDIRRRTPKSISESQKDSEDAEMNSYKAPEYKRAQTDEPVIIKRSTAPAQNRTPSGAPRNTAPVRVSRAPQGARVSGNPAHAKKPVQQVRTSKAPKKSGMAGKKKGLIAVLGIILVLVVAIFGYGYHALGGINYDDGIVPNAYVDESTLASSSSVKNILLLGSDGRDDVTGERSDTMILLSVDKQNKKIKLTSFLRDSYVYIPSKGYSTKLNAAFSYGGAQLVMDTIEYNFGVDIDNYVMIDFAAFKTLVNGLGGITVEGVTAAEAKYLKEVVKIKTQDIVEGTNEFSGNTALWYCRIRKLDNDFKRTERQRKVISAIISKALKVGPFTLMDAVADTVPHISSDMNRNGLLGFGMSSAVKILTYDIEQQQIPASGTWSDGWASGQQVLKMDIEENKAILKSFLYDKDSKKDTAETE